MYFIPICDNEVSPPNIEKEDSTAKSLINTIFFNNAKNNSNGEYFGINHDDLINRAKNILLVQIFMVYQWSVIRARIEHPYKLKNLHFACKEVTPWNFVVEDLDVKMYLENPRFLWRFSVNNYKYFYGIFTKGMKTFNNCKISDELYVDELLTYDLDKSEVMPYYITFCGSLENYIRHLFGKSTRETSKWFKMYDFNKLLENSSSYKLKDYEKEEIKYSYDYILQMIEPNMNYDDFVRIIVTGHTLTDAGPLLKSVIEYEKMLKKQRKDRLKEAKMEKASTSVVEINDNVVIDNKEIDNSIVEANQIVDLSQV